MEKLSDLQYLRLGFFAKLWYNIASFFCGIPGWFVRLGKKIWKTIKNLGIKIKDTFVEIGTTFVHGDWKAKVSYFIMGFGNIMHGQILRGLLFFLFEVVFILYMCLAGGHWLSLFGSLGKTPTRLEMGEYGEIAIPGDDSFKIMLYGLLTIVFIVALAYTWLLNVKQNTTIMKILASGKKLKSNKDDLRSMVDDQFHKTLLALPLGGILIFTVLPIIFMVLVAFTGYDGAHNGYNNLFHWCGFKNFNTLLSTNNGFSATLGEVLLWTLIWAFFATFTNYFLGMFVAIMINKKGIKIKKFWRTVLVLTIAIPQFISLLYVSKLFAGNGLVNATLIKWGWIKNPIPFWTDGNWARAMVIIINIWIGIPYLMLMTTGILMNIPADLYESAKIDGANVWQQYVKITLPYVLFVTGPYLLTSFIANINNFNVIYLLNAGGPNSGVTINGTPVGKTDLLITLLFNMTTGSTADYKLASVIGIIIFFVVAVISLIVYNLMPSTRNEEDYQ